MARNQAADFEQRRETIVENAVTLFATAGFLGTSVADLAKSCKTSKSLIYHYFSSKEDILFEAMDSHVRVLWEAASKIIAMDASPEQKLQTLIHTLMHLYAGAASRHKVLANELYHLPRERRDLIIARQSQLVHAVSDIFTQIRPELKSTPELVSPAAMVFFGMINWTHIWYDPSGPASIDNVANLIVDMALHGITGIHRKA